jgi:hypothetical protein
MRESRKEKRERGDGDKGKRRECSIKKIQRIGPDGFGPEMTQLMQVTRRVVGVYG